MTTMAQAIKNYVSSVGGKVTSEQIKQIINDEYPDKWRPTTLQAHLYACAINNSKAYIHHPFAERFLYRDSDGSFEIYSEELHGPNVWEPQVEVDISDEIEMVETTIGLERDIEDHLVHHLDTIEKGLHLVARQKVIDVGRIDILAEDKESVPVIIEVKVGEAKDSAIGQIARYLGWYAKNNGKTPRGILIAGEFSEGVRYAATAIPNLMLLSYQVHFSFKKVEVECKL